MKQEKIYVVSGIFSNSDDYRTKIFKAFYNKEDAEKYVQKADRILKAMVKHIVEMARIAWTYYDDIADMTQEEMRKYEKSDELTTALNIWSAHSNLHSFNKCRIEEIKILQQQI